MKKIGITLTIFAMIMAAVSVAKAEGVNKGFIEDTLEENGIDWASTQSQYQFPQENCCGQMVPVGTCMMVCFDNHPGFDDPGFNEPIKPLPIWDCCGGTDPNIGCDMACYDDEGKPSIFPVTNLPNNDLPIMPLHTDYNNMQKTKNAIGSNVIENLTEITAKISEIDMDKDPNEGGKILDGFYTGMNSKKKSDSSAVYIEADSQTTNEQTIEEICNAKASKITKLASKVAPLNPTKSEKPLDKNNKIPISAGVLFVGALGLGLAKKKKGYFDNYAEDAQTVWNYVTGGDTNSGNSGSGGSQDHVVVDVETSSGTVHTSTSTDNSCPSSSTACYGQAWVDSQTK